VQSRNFSNARIYSLGWQSKTSLREGIDKTYTWIEQQVLLAEAESAPAAVAGAR
jgi:nucleoside-diphosphate-sugar epimerase